MSALVPVVRYMVICEKVVRDDTKGHPTSLIGLINHLPRGSDEQYPQNYPVFHVFLQIAGCRGPGRGRVQIRHSESEELVFQTNNVHLNFSADPLVVQGLTIRIRHCSLPRPGLYDVQFWYNGLMVAQQPIIAK